MGNKEVLPFFLGRYRCCFAMTDFIKDCFLLQLSEAYVVQKHVYFSLISFIQKWTHFLSYVVVHCPPMRSFGEQRESAWFRWLICSAEWPSLMSCYLSPQTVNLTKYAACRSTNEMQLFLYSLSWLLVLLVYQHLCYKIYIDIDSTLQPWSV